jgi:hypothetical protein
MRLWPLTIGLKGLTLFQGAGAAKLFWGSFLGLFMVFSWSFLGIFLFFSWFFLDLI